MKATHNILIIETICIYNFCILTCMCLCIYVYYTHIYMYIYVHRIFVYIYIVQGYLYRDIICMLHLFLCILYYWCYCNHIAFISISFPLFIDSVLVGSGCHNKIPQTCWLKHQKFISCRSGGWKSKEPAGLVSGEVSLLPGLQTAAFLPVLTWPFLFVHAGRQRKKLMRICKI